MATSNLSNPVFSAVDSSGAPLSGGKLYAYAAGTSTAQDTYTDSTGATANANPVILDSNGQAQVWLGSNTYKLVLTDSSDVTIWTIDNVAELSSLTGSEWLTSGDTPTYVSATSFKVSGDKTTDYQVNRRIQMSITGSTLYGTIASSSYSAPDTTVTVTMDSGSLDNTLSAVNYGLLTATNHAVPLGIYGTGDMLSTNNLSDVASAATSRTNLGLGSVDNTADTAKPVSTAQQTALDLKANLASPTFTGTPSLPTGTTGVTQSSGDNSTKLATTAYADAVSGGKVLQVVNAVYTTNASSSSSTYADTGLTASITPSATSSKVLCIVNQAGCQKSNDTILDINLMRDSTELFKFERQAGYTVTTTQNSISCGGSYLDSPASTSALTYKTQFKSVTAAATVAVQSSSGASSITLIEIGA